MWISFIVELVAGEAAKTRNMHGLDMFLFVCLFKALVHTESILCGKHILLNFCRFLVFLETVLTSLTVAIYVIEQMHTSHFCSFLGKQNFREMVGYRAPETLELLLWDV